MPTDPNSAIAQSRKDLGARLRQLRLTAGLTGRALAERTGQHFSRVSRIENGVQHPDDETLRAWTLACEVPELAAELMSMAQNVTTAYQEWAELARAGMKKLDELHSVAHYAATKVFRIHEPLLLPGLFQTARYQRQMLDFWYEFLGSPPDFDATMTMKSRRTAAALRPEKRVAIVLGEQALRTRRGTAAEHADLLIHLMSMMRLPNVSVSIIPANEQRRAIASTGFWIFDNRAVAIETPTAAIKVTRPQEIQQYGRLFSALRAEGKTGHAASRIIATIIAGD
ncbi:MAG: Scr1 family TA system antitoxin-like transcriptional regulator [Angustibacter sp.]